MGAGEPIATRWSPELKAEIKRSRISATTKLVVRAAAWSGLGGQVEGWSGLGGRRRQRSAPLLSCLLNKEICAALLPSRRLTDYECAGGVRERSPQRRQRLSGRGGESTPPQAAHSGLGRSPLAPMHVCTRGRRCRPRRCRCRMPSTPAPRTSGPRCWSPALQWVFTASARPRPSARAPAAARTIWRRWGGHNGPERARA